MFIDKINLNHIRIFECVYRTRSMTKAADELHMTQSGVSQHIKLLEDILELKLFDRIKQRLIPTTHAVELFKKSSIGLYTIEEGLTNIKNGEKNLAGNIAIGLPIEFGNNIIVPLLAEFGKKNKRVTFNITYGYASDMNRLLMNGDLDFALVDDYSMDIMIATQKIYNEELFLCAHNSYLESFKEQNNLDVLEYLSFQNEDKKFFERIEFIDYVKENALLLMWFKHHFNTTNININVRSTMMDVQGVASMITNGLGAGILPHHHILKLAQEGNKLHLFKTQSKPLLNSISLAYIEEKTRTPTVNSLIDYIIDSLVKK